jgi:hypothetical protein
MRKLCVAVLLVLSIFSGVAQGHDRLVQDPQEDEMDYVDLKDILAVHSPDGKTLSWSVTFWEPHQLQDPDGQGLSLYFLVVKPNGAQKARSMNLTSYEGNLSGRVYRTGTYVGDAEVWAPTETTLEIRIEKSLLAGEIRRLKWQMRTIEWKPAGEGCRLSDIPSECVDGTEFLRLRF